MAGVLHSLGPVRADGEAKEHRSEESGALCLEV